MHIFFFQNLAILIIAICVSTIGWGLQTLYLVNNQEYKVVKTHECTTIIKDNVFYLDCDGKLLTASNKLITKYLQQNKVVGRDTETCQVFRGVVTGNEKTRCN